MDNLRTETELKDQGEYMLLLEKMRGKRLAIVCAQERFKFYEQTLAKYDCKIDIYYYNFRKLMRDIRTNPQKYDGIIVHGVDVDEYNPVDRLIYRLKQIRKLGVPVVVVNLSGNSTIFSNLPMALQRLGFPIVDPQFRLDIEQFDYQTELLSVLREMNKLFVAQS